MDGRLDQRPPACVRLALTLDGIRNLICDLRAAGQVPGAILLSEREKKDIKLEIMSYATEVSPDAEETLDRCLAMIGGVPVVSHPAVTPGKCRILPRDPIVRRHIDNDILNRALTVA